MCKEKLSMTGNNKLLLNDATMLEIVQFWLDAQFVTPPTCTSIRLVLDRGYRFEVSIENKEKEVTSNA